MIANITNQGQTFKVDLSKPIDISLPLKAGLDNPTAWHVPEVKMEAVIMGDWVGDAKKENSPPTLPVPPWRREMRPFDSISKGRIS